MAMRNPLQDQLLKAGLVKKSKAAQIVREQTRQRHGKSAPPTETPEVDARRLQAETGAAGRHALSSPESVWDAIRAFFSRRSEVEV